MAEYIEREEAKEAVKFVPWCDWKAVGNCLDELPAVDVVPVKHGRWVNMTIAIVDTVGSCTNCGKEAVWRSRNKPYSICPHCGAKMDLEG